MNNLHETLNELLGKYTLYQVLDALANVVDERTKDSPSYDLREIGGMLRKARKRILEYVGSGD